MSFSEAKPGGWVTGERLLPAQMNQINTDLANALDAKDGGSYTLTDNLSIATPTGKAITMNGAAFDPVVDGGDLRPSGAVRGRHWVAAPDCSSTGTKAIPYYVEHVYPGGFGYPVASGVIWQVGTPPTGSTDRRWVMRLVNFSSNSIAVKDAGGATLQTILTNTNAIRACTIAYDGSAWVVIDLDWYHG